MLPSVRHIISGKEIEVVASYKHLRLQVDDRLDWSINTDHTYKKVQSRLYFLRKAGILQRLQENAADVFSTSALF